MPLPKYLRTDYFRKNPWVKQKRTEMGAKNFDNCYLAIFKFVSNLMPGQFFYVRDLCRKNPENHDFVVQLIDLFNAMDFFENLDYDAATDRVTRNKPNIKVQAWPYHSVNVFFRIVRDPEAWGIEKSDLI